MDIDKLINEIAEKVNLPNGHIDIEGMCKDFAKICVNEALNQVKNSVVLADVSGSFLSDLNFIIDNMGYDLVKDKVSKEAQTEYLKRLKIMRDELRQNCN
jgi:hypothetical protein